MNAYFSTEAWLLTSRPIGEADRLITFFTRDLGRVDAVAKGVRLAKSKLKGHLTLFVRLRVILAPGKEYWRLVDAESANGVEQHPEHAHQQEFAKFLGLVASHSAPDETLWEAILGFGALDSREKLVALELKTLSILGMLPEDAERPGPLVKREKRIAETLWANHMVY